MSEDPIVRFNLSVEKSYDITILHMGVSGHKIWLMENKNESRIKIRYWLLRGDLMHMGHYPSY